MIGLRCFICIILFLNMYTVVMGDLRKLSWVLKRYEKERFLEKFLTDAESHLMQNCPSRQITIIAPNDRLLRAAAPIFDSRPYYLGTDFKFLVGLREFAKNSCVFVFIDKIDYDYLATLFSDMPSHYRTKVQILSINNLPKDKVKNTLYLAFEKAMENVTIIYPENKKFKAFQVYPLTRNCKKEIRLSYIWIPNKGLKMYYYDDQSPRNFNKCPVPISTLPSMNAIDLHENPDGTLDILGGREGNLIMTFAEKLNFTAVVKYPEIQDWERVVNNTLVGLVSDIENGKSLIAIGELIATVERYKYSDFTASYDNICLVWTTPAITAPTEAVLYLEFGPYLWATVMFFIIFSSIFIYSLSRTRSSNRERITCVVATLDVICATIGIPVHRLSASRPAKMYFVSYMLYAIVAVTAYKTYLASILTVKEDVQLIKTEADIARFELTPGGGYVPLNILQTQREESPYMPYLIDNFEIFVNTVAILDRIKYKKDFAFLTHLSEMEFYKRNLSLADEEVYFYLFDQCVILYHSVALVRKGSSLTTELNIIIQKLVESGLVRFWNKEKRYIDMSNTHPPDAKLQKLNLKQLRSIFIFYISGIILATAIMIFELIYRALSKRTN